MIHHIQHFLKGHNGSKLEREKNPDKLKHIRPEGQCCCGKCLPEAEIIDHIKRQVFDITLPKRFVTEFVGEVWLYQF